MAVYVPFRLAFKRHRISLPLLAPLLASALLCLATPALAFEGVIEKQTLALPAFTFQDGHTLPLQLGYETYGHLDATKSNAILVCHYFGGTSHAAGRYAATDAKAGFWDGLIGSKLAIDTDRYFVICADVPANINVGDPHMHTTGPESVDPQTGKPYGSHFPVVSIRDMVETQRALRNALGITRWHAVMGASLGGMQALQWAVSYPKEVARVAAFAAPGRSDGYNQAMCQIMIDAIGADAKWQNGDYDPANPPTAGLGAAWKLLYAQVLAREATLKALSDMPPAATAWEQLNTLATNRTPQLDAGAYRALSRASRDFNLGQGGSYEAALGRIEAKLLVVAAKGDQLFPPEAIDEDLIGPLTRAGKHPAFRVLDTAMGHLGAVVDLAKLGPDIGAFIDSP